MKKTSVVKYYDPDTTASVFLAANYYGVKVIDTEPDGEDQVRATVYGEAEDVDMLKEAVGSGDVEPMCRWRDLDDEEYAEKLKAELASLGFEWNPPNNEEIKENQNDEEA